MMNIVYLVGRLATDPKTMKKDEKEYLSFKMSVKKSYKNDDGIFESDIFPVEIPFLTNENYKKYMHKCDLVGIKGYLSYKNKKIVIMVEKLSFLAKKNCEDNSNED